MTSEEILKAIETLTRWNDFIRFESSDDYGPMGDAIEALKELLKLRERGETSKDPGELLAEMTADRDAQAGRAAGYASDAARALMRLATMTAERDHLKAEMVQLREAIIELATGTKDPA